MKLLTFTTRKYLIFSLVYFMIASAGVYIALNRIVLEEIDERMESIRALIINQIDNGFEVESFWPFWEIREAEKSITLQPYSRDTLIVTPDENEAEKFHQLKFTENIKGKEYLIIVRTPRLESYNLLFAIGIPVGMVIFIWMVFFLILNRRISYQIWRPFHSNLGRLKKFSVSDGAPLKLEESKIDELESLRRTLIGLANKGIADFRNLREFTENASHEIQTPLSIITTQIENLMNSHPMDPGLAVEIEKIYASVQRLSKTNKSLLLLSKIENRQFELSESINLSEGLAQDFDSFKELIEAKQIAVVNNIRPAVIQKSNRELFRILVNNLVGNAIRHNYYGGNLEILLDEDHLNVSNSGQAYSGYPEKWFSRFSKADPSSSSAGLGLSIVKEICDLHGWKISYTINKAKHNITVSF